MSGRNRSLRGPPARISVYKLHTLRSALHGDSPDAVRANRYDDGSSFRFVRIVDEEYERPRDRRFHAQTMACPSCGPLVSFKDNHSRGELNGAAALTATIKQLRAGKIIALTRPRRLSTVGRCDERSGGRATARAQGSPRKAAGRDGRIDRGCPTAGSLRRQPNWPHSKIHRHQSCLCGLMPTTRLAAAIHPHLDTVGLMRPTTPLHAILARDFGRPLVCTSGNREGDPLEFKAEAAEKQLAGIADLWLHHDRAILRPIDDSVVRVIAGRRVTIRLARGLAPLSLDLPAMPPTIALGGFLKAAVAWSNGTQVGARSAHRRSGKPRRARTIPGSFEGLAAALPVSTGAVGARHAPRILFHAVGAEAAAPADCCAASSRACRRRHVGTRLARSAGARRCLGRHRLRNRRHDLGRRVPGVYCERI